MYLSLFTMLVDNASCLFQILHTKSVFNNSNSLFTDQPGFNSGSVGTVSEGENIRVSWTTPFGFFTTLSLIQCRDSNDDSENCITHDVTDVTTLSVNRSNGTLFTLVVWQDRDDVLSYQFEIDSGDSSSTEDKGTHFCAR